MALFTDGNISTVEDLTEHDAGLLAVAVAEGIDVSRKLALAQEEIGVELAAMMPRIDSYDAQWQGKPAVGLERVVVTGPLRLWHAFHALELVYRDAYYNQLNDRYKSRQAQYRDLSKWAWGKLLETGVGIVQEPLSRAEAPRLSAVMGAPGTPETTYYARVSWTNARGEEGAAGAWNLATVPAGMALQVEAVSAPPNATGWNVYVGYDAEEMAMQNAVPLTVGGAWVQVAEPAAGKRPGSGQQPSYLRGLPRVLQRG
jgi:hypothetical protein